MYAARCAGASASDERRAVEAERAAVEAEITRLQEAKEDLDAAYGEVAERKRQATAAWEQARDAAWQAARATRRREHR